MLASKDGLVVEVEEGFFPLLYSIVLTQGYPWHRDNPTLYGLEALVDTDTNFLKGLELRIVSQLSHQL